MIQKIAASTVKQASGSRVISEEADKNLERVRQVTRAVKEQERGTMMIVEALENLRELSHRIITSTREQTQGNRLYLHNILNDNEKIKLLHSTALKQHVWSRGLKTSMANQASYAGQRIQWPRDHAADQCAHQMKSNCCNRHSLPISHPAIETPTPSHRIGASIQCWTWHQTRKPKNPDHICQHHLLQRIAKRVPLTTINQKSVLISFTFKC